ncbi:MAG: hypothetical protein ACJAT1_000949 [Marivirga sp.]|jgi:hypothetical protein
MRIKSKDTTKYLFGLALLFSSILFSACPSVPEFPLVPSINFDQVQYYQEQTETGSGQILSTDVIQLSIYFEDGNGDLGLSSSEINAPYQAFFFQFTPANILIFIGDNDTLPAYNPLDYFIPNSEDSILIGQRLITSQDTLYIQLNPRNKNIFIKTFYQPNPNGDFVEFQWDEAPYFETFDGRFPLLNSELYERPLNGTLTYKIKSSGFLRIFRENPIIVETYILDRAGNKSNTVRSEPFVLKDVAIDN